MSHYLVEQSADPAPAEMEADGLNEDVREGGTAGQWTSLGAFQLSGTWFEFVPAIQNDLSLLGRSSQSFLAKQREHKSPLCMDRDRQWPFDDCC